MKPMFSRPIGFWSACVLLMLVVSAAVACRPRSEMPADSSAASVEGKTADFFAAGNRFTSWKEVDHFLGEVQPLLGKRCVVCHGCDDAPCSLKLSSHTGIMRGGSKANPFAVRVGAQEAPLMQANAPGFHEVIHPTSFNDSLLYQHIKLGWKNTTDAGGGKPFSLQSLQPLRNQYAASPKYSCPADLREFQAFAQANPTAGMPFGLPRLDDQESQTLLRWITGEGAGIAAGPKGAAAAQVVTPARVDVVNQWEQFLNGEQEMKQRLVSRYLYEHLFNAHIFFDEMPGEFYQMVRSLNAPPSYLKEFRPVNEYVTPLPTDAPPSNRPIFYRFKKLDHVITQKDHVPFRLSLSRIEDMKKLFFDPQVPYNVTRLPGYETANVFANFSQIPAVIRHRFMLENARYIVDSMVRAAVCTGQSATFAIPDHFWAFFLRPEMDPTSGAPIPISPEGVDSLDMSVTAWTKVGAVEDRFVRNFTFLTEFENSLRANLKRQGKSGLGLEHLWFGEPLRTGGPTANRNSWLSITRHDTSTTVQYGQEGGYPQTLWVLSYANFERLYYNLVVNFQFWGDLPHKLGTWRNMSHHRMDGEDLFVSMLPPADRQARRTEWSGGLELGDISSRVATAMRGVVRLKTGLEIGRGELKRYIDLYPLQSLRDGGRPTAVTYAGAERSDVQLAKQIRERMRAAGVKVVNDDLNANDAGENIYLPQPANPAQLPTEVRDFASFERGLAIANRNRGWRRFAAQLPASVIVRVHDGAGNYRLYSINGNRGYKSHNISLLSSSETSAPLRDAQRDTVSIYRGIVGDFPQLFLDLELAPAPGPDGRSGPSARDFLLAVHGMNPGNGGTVMTRIHQQFAIQRNSQKFWPFVDWLHAWMANHESDLGPGHIYAGILDLSRYDVF